jgi:hypothetical protein
MPSHKSGAQVRASSPQRWVARISSQSATRPIVTIPATSRSLEIQWWRACPFTVRSYVGPRVRIKAISLTPSHSQELARAATGSSRASVLKPNRYAVGWGRRQG